MISQTERHQFILNKLSKESFVNVLEPVQGNSMFLQ